MAEITAPPTSHAGGTRIGVLLMLLGMVMFTLNDVLGKWLVSTYSAQQVMLVRSLAAIVILLPFFWRNGWQRVIRVEKPRLQALRAFLTAIEATAFYFAVAHMPLADAMTYWLAAPIYVAALSPLMLGEHVGWRRWTAILIGFAGVVIALEPSVESLKLPALIALGGSVAYSFAIIFVRALRTTPDTTLVFWQMAAAVIVSIVGISVDPSGWTAVRPIDLVLLSLLGIVAMAAHLLVNRSLKLADAATVVPLQYTLLLWAVLFGWIFFGDVPRTAMLIGAGCIVASGLFIFFREQTLARAGRR